MLCYSNSMVNRCSKNPIIKQICLENSSYLENDCICVPLRRVFHNYNFRVSDIKFEFIRNLLNWPTLHTTSCPISCHAWFSCSVGMANLLAWSWNRHNNIHSLHQYAGVQVFKGKDNTVTIYTL